MHFVIFCIDKPGINRDPSVMQAHIDYLNKSPVKNVISGPLTGDDGEGISEAFTLLKQQPENPLKTSKRTTRYLERTIGKL